MPPVIEISEASRHVGEEVSIRGWLYNKRESGKLLFPLIRDGSGIMQGVVVKKEVSPEVFSQVKSLTQESTLQVTGSIRQEPRAPGGHEMSITGVEIYQLLPDDDPYPITPKDHGIEFLMDRRHLWLRSSRQRAILGIRHEIIRACRDYFDDRGFTLVDTPILTPAACEGTTSLFEVNYFEDKAYLAQTGQLYNEAAAAAVGKAYCFGPTFRAEKSKTRRHLTEFWMIEPEVAFAHLEDIMVLAEELITFVVGRVVERRAGELATLERDPSKLKAVTAPFPRITYDEALRILKEKGSNIEWGKDLGGTDETLLSEAYEKPVMVHRYPAAIKAFYMQPDAEQPDRALCVDVLAPEGYGEIVGGSERISDLALLERRLEEQRLSPETFRWYLDLRRYGTCPHSGFGMGIERVVAWICGLDHVRETIPFPRMLYRLYP
ncbi:MAG: asparagine--tRNA ligase [Acidobacteriota bacterium]